MTLRDQMEADVSAVFLNTDEHGEQAIYKPKGMEARTITAIVDEDGTSQDQERSLADRLYAVVFVSRDANGIDSPQAGDTLEITRAGQQLVFAYEGEVGDADEFSWWLRFSRTSTKRHGGNVGPR